MTASSKTIIIGIGNAHRGDDGTGLAVARALRPKLPPEIEVIEQFGEGTSLMDAWRGASRVILIDAVHSGAAPGTIHHIDASTSPVPTALFPCSTHAFGVADAIEMARALHRLPPQVNIYGIESANFDEIEGLSPEVTRAVAAVARQILEDLHQP